MTRAKLTKPNRVPDTITNRCKPNSDCFGNKFFVVNPEKDHEQIISDILRHDTMTPVSWTYTDCDSNNKLITRITELNLPMVLRTKVPIKSTVLRGMRNFWNTIIYEVGDPCPREDLAFSMKEAFESGLNVVITLSIIPEVTKFIDIVNFIMMTNSYTRRYILKFAETLSNPVSEKFTEPNGNYFRATEEYRKKFLHQLDLVFSAEKSMSIAVCGSCKSCLGVTFFKYQKMLDIYVEVSNDA